MPPPAPSWMAITRRDFIVRRYELNRAQFVLLENLSRGQTIGAAIIAASDVYQHEPGDLAAELHGWFELWTTAPMFAAIADDSRDV